MNKVAHGFPHSNDAFLVWLLRVLQRCMTKATGVAGVCAGVDLLVVDVIERLNLFSW